jgi:hypothetical protein
MTMLSMPSFPKSMKIKRTEALSLSTVIPAKAGIHHLTYKFQTPVMDPRLRGGDESGTGRGPN